MSNCNKIQKLIPLYVYHDSELSGSALTDLESHLDHCPECQAELERVQQFMEKMKIGLSIEPTETFLMHSRNLLHQRLKSVHKPTRTKNLLQSSRLLFNSEYLKILRYSIAGAILLIVFWIGRISVGSKPAETSILAGSIGSDVHSGSEAAISTPRIVGVHSISYYPETEQVEMKYTVMHQVAVRGAVFDTPVRQLLAWTAMYADHPGNRLQSVKALGAGKPVGEDVRDALIYVIENDENAGVRLKAINSLMEIPQDEMIKNALIDRMLHDPNSKIRMEAISALSSLPAHEITVPLQTAAQNDENKYIRVKASKLLE
ncbi:HEAT repeat domain-containing protein [candidate division KSB1 bacterium]|nr:HEAT repeat domain-containing protein [candidate division KSB1 bacterium]